MGAVEVIGRSLSRRTSRIQLELLALVVVGVVGLLAFDGRATLWVLVVSTAIGAAILEIDGWWGSSHPVPDRSDVVWHRRYRRGRVALSASIVALVFAMAWLVDDGVGPWGDLVWVWSAVMLVIVGERVLQRRLGSAAV